ncbi:MAG: DNA repair exonuclease [Firmicutes bacterium]|nr:DNA repair exonuclease [Bacillota bacterium]
MDGIKVLHTGDLHLGMSFAGSKLPAEVGRVRRQELWETFDRIIDTAKAEKVNLLLIAGDLFEYKYCTVSDIKRINDRFARIPETKVCIAPGNHDPALSDSLYNTCRWEQNVHIFRKSRVSALRIEEYNTTVWGLGWDKDCIADPLLESFRAKDDGINILMAHCDVVPGGSVSNYLPVYHEQLAGSGVHYAALGHIHKGGEIKQGGKKVGVYCGSPEPLDFGEVGTHGVYIGTVGRNNCGVNFLPVAKREFVTERITADPTGDTATILKSMEERIKKYGQANLFRFSLEGGTDPGVELDTAYLERTIEAFHIEIKNNTFTGYDLDAIIEEGQRSIMGAFAARLLEQLDGESDPERRAVLERALYIGLDALNGRKVMGR